MASIELLGRDGLEFGGEECEGIRRQGCQQRMLDEPMNLGTLGGTPNRDP